MYLVLISYFRLFRYGAPNLLFGSKSINLMADYNHLVSSTSPAGQDTKAWEFEMINRLKKDASVFQKRPIRDYLDY